MELRRVLFRSSPSPWMGEGTQRVPGEGATRVGSRTVPLTPPLSHHPLHRGEQRVPGRGRSNVCVGIIRERNSETEHLGTCILIVLDLAVTATVVAFLALGC